MYEVVQIRLREAGKITYFSPGGMHFKVGEYVSIREAEGDLVTFRVASVGRP